MLLCTELQLWYKLNLLEKRPNISCYNTLAHLIYSLEVICALLIIDLASQPDLIFCSLHLRHGNSKILLHAITTIGRKTAIINVGGVYQKNWPKSIHLFHANTSA